MSVSHTSGVIESHPSCRGCRVAIFCLRYTLRRKKQFSVDCVRCDVHSETVERVNRQSYNNTAYHNQMAILR